MAKNKIILPAIRAIFGDWVYYSSIMSAKQVSEWILPAKKIREAETLDEILQRDLKARKEQISKYLLTKEQRFFNSLIIGVYNGLPDWIEFDISAKIEELNLKTEESINESMGLLVFHGNEKMFAIDGQHRVAGIDIAYKKDNSEILKDDNFSVIFLAHIDDTTGRKRTRRLFSDINKNAKPVAKSDRIKIDEEDISAIVTRRIYANFPYFQNGKLIALDKSNLVKGNFTNFTNLDNLYTVTKELKKIFNKPRNTNDWDEDNIQILQKIVEDFLNFVIENINEYQDYFQLSKLTLKEARNNNKYLLFRPVGLTLLAKIYIKFYKENKLTYLKQNINKISFIFPESPFNKVIWNKGKMEVKSSNQSLAYNIALYILNSYPTTKNNELLERYRDITKNENASLPQKIK